MTTYKLVFLRKARKEWEKLGETLRRQFRAKLAERLRHPRVPKDALRRQRDCYKIKLRSAGYRLVYRVDDDRVIVTVIAVGEREGEYVYSDLESRLAEGQ
ncbi:MAG: type II toxin-antitoxin system RelE/ParE family toxin [Alphaproteobacteria bacterium]|nr:type II toxin-antitoxin system RelE/ParE family toxin [Alphaproteobacteria bacterium]